MQTIKLDVEDSFNTINAKLAEIDFTKDYKIELDGDPVIVTKIADNLYYATTQSSPNDISYMAWEFSSTHTADKEILSDLFNSWRNMGLVYM